MHTSNDSDDPVAREEDDPERLFAELEGATEGPGGRGRDQEVISQTERAPSRAAATDRSVALAELRAWVEALIAQRAEIEIVSVIDGVEDSGALRLRCSASERSLMLEFDAPSGILTVYRDTVLHARIGPYDERTPDAPRRSIGTELAWLNAGRPPIRTVR
jgi:hypothetical protein